MKSLHHSDPVAAALIQGVVAHAQLEADHLRRPADEPIAAQLAIKTHGPELTVVCQGTETRGRLSGLFIFAARIRATPFNGRSSLRYLSQLTVGGPAQLNGKVATALFLAGLELVKRGERQEGVLCLRRATFGLPGGEEDWRHSLAPPPDILALAPKDLLEEATRGTIVEQTMDEAGELSPLQHAKRICAFATNADPTVRHGTARALTDCVQAIVNSSAEKFAAVAAPALMTLAQDASDYVREEAIIALDALADNLAQAAVSWRRHHRTRLASVARLSPLVEELARQGVDLDAQDARRSLDGTPTVPPPGAENGPWAKEVAEALRVLKGLAH